MFTSDLRMIFIFFVFILYYNQIISQTNIDKRITKKDFYLTESKNYIGWIIDYYIDKDENIYIVEKNSIHKFNKEGKEINYFYSQGNGPGEFGRLNKIIVDKKNNIFLEDVKNRRILKYNSNLIYLSEFKKYNISPITKWVIVNDSLLITYSILEFDKIIGIYNIKDNKFLRSFGNNSKIFLKYREAFNGGDMTYFKGSIYFIYNLEYQLLKANFNGKVVKIKNEIPKHFVTIRGKNNDNNPFHIPYSIISNLFIIDGKFYIFSFPPSNNNTLSNPVYDILDINGKIVKENLHSKYLPQAKQISPKKFIKIVDQRNIYPQNDPKSKIFVRIISIKN